MEEKTYRGGRNSVSVAGYATDMIPATFFSLNFFIAAQWQGLIDNVLWILAGTLLILIGSGLWVQENRHKSLWTKLKESLKLEKSEVGYLVKSFFRPSGAEIILEIFARFAYIDRELAAGEQELIQTFADTWHIEVDWDEHRKLAGLEQPVSFVKARDSVERYLNTSPPEEQIGQLIDVLHALVKVDENISEQEKLIFAEVQQFLLGYIDDTDVQAKYTVVIAPQNRRQDAAIESLLPNVRKIEIAGGSGYLVGSFYSQDYAHVICDQYRELGFFTIDLMGTAPVTA